MAKLNVTAADLPRLEKIRELSDRMQKLQHLTENRTDKVLYQGRTWVYEDLVVTAYDYYVLAKNYGLNVTNFVKWLTDETAILAKHNLVWPVKK